MDGRWLRAPFISIFSAAAPTRVLSGAPYAAMERKSSRGLSAGVTMGVAATLAVVRAWTYVAVASSYTSATSFTAAVLVFAAAIACGETAAACTSPRRRWQATLCPSWAHAP